MKAVVNRTIGIVMAISFILILAITSVEAVVYWMPGYFEYEYEKHQVLDDVNMEMEDLLEVTDHMMAYLRGEKADLQIYTDVDGMKAWPFFNQREILHMIDVKHLFLGGLMIRRICGLFLLAGLILLWKRKALRSLPKSICIGTGVFFGVTCLLVLIVSRDFTKYFTVFHHIFFNNDLWILNPRTDRLINIVPEPFFIDTAAAIAIVFGISIFLILLIAGYLHKKWNK